jgi:hypothetical protein
MQLALAAEAKSIDKTMRRKKVDARRIRGHITALYL